MHINKLNNKCYIGITCNSTARRWQNGSGYMHKENGRYHQPKFANAINKYGWENFEHIILEDGLSKDEACEKEKYYISYFNTIENGYNCYDGGDVGRLGKPHSEETKRLLSNMLKGRRHTKEAKRKITEAQLGRPCKEETKRKISEALKRNGCNKDRISRSNPRARKVLQFTRDNELVREWDCIMDIERELGFAHSNISKCCRHKIETAYNFIWGYKHE